MPSTDFPRRGAWASLKGRVCIIAEHPQVSISYDQKTEERIEERDASLAEVHFVNEDGTTGEVRRGVSVTSLSQATRTEIPKARRPDVTRAKLLGYE